MDENLGELEGGQILAFAFKKKYINVDMRVYLRVEVPEAFNLFLYVPMHPLRIELVLFPLLGFQLWTFNRYLRARFALRTRFEHSMCHRCCRCG